MGPRGVLRPPSPFFFAWQGAASACRATGVSGLRLMCSSKGLSSGGTAVALRERLLRHLRRDRREEAITLALDLLGLRPASRLATLPSGASARRSALSALVLPHIGTPARLFALYQDFNSAVLCYATTQPAAPDLAAVFPSALAAGGCHGRRSGGSSRFRGRRLRRPGVVSPRHATTHGRALWPRQLLVVLVDGC